MIAQAESPCPRPWYGELSWLAARWDVLAWVGVLASALVLRVVRLGGPPLNVEEGSRALDALTLWREGRVAYEGGPIFTNLLSLVFGLFTAADGQARLLSAVSGVALAAVPWLLRPALGTRATLGASLILALSSLLTSNARAVSPAVPAALLLLLAVACFWRFGLRYERGWLVGGAVAVAVGLGFDPSFTVGLIGVALAYAIAEGDILGRSSWLPALKRWGPLALVGAVLTAVVLDTRFLMNPSGLQAGLVDPFWRWTGDVARGSGLTAPLIVVLLDGAVLLLAVVGLGAYRRRPRAVRFLGTWLLVALTLAALMRMPDTRYLVQPVLPAALLGGFGLVRAIEAVRVWGNTTTTVVALAGLVPIVTASFQINTGLRQGGSPWGAAGVVLVAGLLLVGLVAFNLLRREGMLAALSTWLLVLLTYSAIGGLSRALEARGDARGTLVERSTMTTEVREIRETALRWFRADPTGSIPIDPSLRPILGWAVRDVPTARFDRAAREQTVDRFLADPPANLIDTQAAVRHLVGYEADWATLSLSPNRLWLWYANRQSLVTLRPYAIVVVQSAGG
ncbi:MAG: glycosyltransferase family 39 protein [Chloroflexi bacterium]|nr:glycosyltransferase family 39 protein [Chloroflexota bacterium]